jgi:hypothetical protein
VKRAYAIGATLALVVVGASGFVRSAVWRGDRPPAEGRAQPLPTLPLTDEAAAALTRIRIVQPDWGDAGERPPAVTLERHGDRWDITSPWQARASGSKVAALIANLKSLALRERVDPGSAAYEECHVTDEQAVHVVASAGAADVRDLFFGKSDVRGQLVRVAGVDGVFAMPSGGPGGYQGFLYTRPLRSWRETEIFHFDPSDVVEVDVTNRHGRFVFVRSEGGWTGTKAPADRLAAPDAGSLSWPRFDPGTIDELLKAMRSLAADDFGDDSQRADAGVDDAERTGGVVRIRFAPASAHADGILRVGTLSTNTGRWAIAGSRWAVEDGADRALYALAPWTADWATGDTRRFEVASEIEREPERRAKPE